MVDSGASRMSTEREFEELRGYALGLDAVVRQLMSLLPTSETLEGALRRSLPHYPEVAVREIVANALIHQDFTVTGAGPMVEVFEAPPGSTRVVLFGPRPLGTMARSERVWVCDWHASLRHVPREALTNASLRDRFGLDDSSRTLVSRTIREAVEAGAIKPVDPEAAPKMMRYLPWWA